MEKFPFYKQETCWTCGAAAMRMILEHAGIKKTEKQVVTLLKTNKIRGTWHKQFPQVAEKYKLTYVVKRNATIQDLKKYKKQHTIMVCYYYPKEKVDHYSIIKKITNDRIYFYDPWFGKEHSYTLNYFKTIWKSDPNYDNEKSWFFAIKKIKYYNYLYDQK